MEKPKLLVLMAHGRFIEAADLGIEVKALDDKFGVSTRDFR